jgi:hypothetical protein
MSTMRKLPSNAPISLLLALGLLALLGATRPAAAASINYGNFGPVVPGITFLQVTESSNTDPVPLYGPPSPFSVGLDFDPIGFVANAGGGSADLTDGQLNFSVLSSPEGGIGTISLFEAGDYSVLGLGGAATSVFAGATLRVVVTEVNGLAVAPINLTPSNASFGDALPGNVILQPWSLGVTVNVAAQLAQDQRATRIDVVIDNQLAALSEAGSLAFLAKKEFQIRVDTDRNPPVSEPSALLFGAMALLPVLRKRRH